MSEQPLQSIEILNQTAVDTMSKQLAGMNSHFGVVLDCDETLYNTVARHYRFIQLASRFGILPQLENFPTYDDVVHGGGTGFFADAFVMSADDWEARMVDIRARRAINRNSPLLHPDVAQIVGGIEPLLGYVTAKPGTPRVHRIATQDLSTRKFPDLPMVLRPEGVPLSKTAQWKIETMEHIIGKSGKRMVIIDDSISTARVVEEYNQTHGKVRIAQVLYPGPLTSGKLDSGEYVPSHEHGIVVADWNTIPQVIATINELWQ